MPTFTPAPVDLEFSEPQTVTGPWTFTQPLTAPLEDSGGAWIDVRTRGAKVDGVTDDSTAFNSASAAAAIIGGTVFVPAGVLRGQGLVIYSNVRYLGAGVGATTIKLVDGANVDLLVTQNFATLTGTATRAGPSAWSLEELALDGNKAANASGWPLRIYGDDYKALNVDIGNGASGGVWTEWGDGTGPAPRSMEAQWVNFKIHDNNGVGLLDYGPHDSTFTQGVVFRNTGDGIKIDANTVGGNGGIGSVFTNVHAWGNSQQWAWNTNLQVFLTNCEGEGGTLGQLRMGGAKSVVVGGVFFNAGGAAGLGIVIDNNANRLFIDTSVFDCTTAALKVITGSGESTIKIQGGSASAGTAVVGAIAGDTFAQITTSYAGTITGLNQVPADASGFKTTVAGVTSNTLDDGAGNLVAKTSVSAGSPQSQISSDGRIIVGANRPDRPQVQFNVHQATPLAVGTVMGMGRDNNDAGYVNTLNGFYRLLSGVQQVGPGYSPSLNNLVAANYEPCIADTTTALTSGQIYFLKLLIDAPTTVTSYVLNVTAAGVTLTAGQNFVGLYKSDGTRLDATSADAFFAQFATPVLALGSGPIVVMPPYVFVGILCVGTTGVTLSRKAFTTAGVNQVATTLAGLRFAGGGGGKTALPSPLSGQSSGSATAWWAGLS